MNAGVSETILNLMGDNDLNTVSLFYHTFSDKDDLRDTFKQVPFNLSGTDLPTKLALGKVISVWSACGENENVQLKADAERVLQHLPPQIPPLALDASKDLFDQAYPKMKLDKAKTPSKPFFEKGILQSETAF